MWHVVNDRTLLAARDKNLKPDNHKLELALIVTRLYKNSTIYLMTPPLKNENTNKNNSQ